MTAGAEACVGCGGVGELGCSGSGGLGGAGGKSRRVVGSGFGGVLGVQLGWRRGRGWGGEELEREWEKGGKGGGGWGNGRREARVSRG